MRRFEPTTPFAKVLEGIRLVRLTTGNRLTKCPPKGSLVHEYNAMSRMARVQDDPTRTVTNTQAYTLTLLVGG